MRKYIMGTMVVGFMALLAGCQSNNVNTLFSPYPYSAPMTLTQSVQDALYRSGDPIIAQVHVETNQNTVFLSGYVKKIRQSDTAEQIARQVPGVQVVENRLIVRQ